MLPAFFGGGFAMTGAIDLTRRAIVTGSVGGAMAASTAASAGSPDPFAADEVIQLSQTANAALMRGDAETYTKLITFSDDFTFMSPFGGQPSKRSAFTPESMIAMGRFFKNGTFEQEVVQSYVAADLVVLVIIERQNVEVGGLPAQDWPLRVTLVYRRVGSEWQLAHRHADPLLKAIGFEKAALLARGNDRC